MIDQKRPRVRDAELLKSLHKQWRECALCGSVGWEIDARFPDKRTWVGLSLHHFNNHPRDDMIGNLVMLCGHGTLGCHGIITLNDREHLGMLGIYVVEHRPDTVEYLDWRLGGLEKAKEWLQRVLWVTSPLVASPDAGQRGAP